MSLVRTQEADILLAAIRIMAKYRSGIAGTMADLEDTERALRLPVVDEDPATVDHAARSAA